MKNYVRTSFYSNPKTQNQLNQIIEMVKCNKSELIRFIINEFYIDYMEQKLNIVIKEIEYLEKEMEVNK